MCWVMPPASPLTTLVSRMASSSEVLPWSTWPMMVTTGGRSASSDASSSNAGSAVGPSAAGADLALVLERRLGRGLVAGVDDLDLLAELLGQQRDRLVGERLGEGDHLPHAHQLLDDVGHRDAEVLGHVAHRRAGVDPDDVGAAERVGLERRRDLLEHLAATAAAAAATGSPAGGATARRAARAARTAGTTRAAGAATGGLRVDDDAAAAAAGPALVAQAAARRARGLGLRLVARGPLGLLGLGDDLGAGAGRGTLDDLGPLRTLGRGRLLGLRSLLGRLLLLLGRGRLLGGRRLACLGRRRRGRLGG